jgi:hypothetical protein
MSEQEAEPEQDPPDPGQPAKRDGSEDAETRTR